jgi:hypothetical protein
MKITKLPVDDKKRIPSIYSLYERSRTIDTTYPFIFFVDIDHTILIILETDNKPYDSFSISDRKIDFYMFNNYIDVSNNISIYFEIIDIKSIESISRIKIVEVIQVDTNIYEIKIIKSNSIFMLKIKFRRDIVNFFLMLRQITPYVGLFTAGNREYASIIYKLLTMIYNINLSFFFSESELSFKDGDYNCKDMEKVMNILKELLILSEKPVYTIPILIDDNPLWCVNGWIIPINKLTYNDNTNFDHIYIKDIIYSNIQIDNVKK